MGGHICKTDNHFESIKLIKSGWYLHYHTKLLHNYNRSLFKFVCKNKIHVPDDLIVLISSYIYQSRIRWIIPKKMPECNIMIIRRKIRKGYIIHDIYMYAMGNMYYFNYFIINNDLHLPTLIPC